MVLFSLFLTSKQTQSKNPTSSKLFHFRRKNARKKQKNRTRKEKRTICCQSAPTKNHDQIPRETEYGTLFGPISSLFSIAYLLLKRDTGPRMVPQSESHKKLNRQNRQRDLPIKNATLEIFYVFPLIVTGKHTRSKNPTTSKLFHSRPQLRYPVWSSIS